MLEKYGHTYFSARQHGPVLEGKPRSVEEAERVFWVNINSMAGIDWMIVVVDYLLPPDVELRKVRAAFNPNGLLYAAESPILEIPDTGTVFEAGVFFGAFEQWKRHNFGRCEEQEKPKLVLFTQSLVMTMNLMLTRCAKGILCGTDHLEVWLDSKCNEKVLFDWPEEDGRLSSREADRGI